jgi:UrcA family protein
MVHPKIEHYSKRAPPIFGRLLFIGAATMMSLGGVAFDSPAFAKAVPVIVYAPGDLLTRRIDYADLDLASPPGERALNRRAHAAVSSLCSEVARFDGTVEANNIVAQCYNSTWEQARPQIDRAINRARDLASTGSPSTLATSIAIVLLK